MKTTDTTPQHATLSEADTDAGHLARIGKAGTLVYAGLVIAYVLCKWDKFAKLEPNSLGDFLAGVAGPLALFWLVLGYFQQGRELAQNTEALRLQKDELAHAVEQARQLVQVSQAELETLKLHREQDEARKSAERQVNFEHSSTGPVSIDVATTDQHFVSTTITFSCTGAEAREIDIRSSSDALVVSNRHIPYVSSKGEFNISIRGTLLIAQSSSLETFITIAGRNVHGEHRADKFSISIAPKGQSTNRYRLRVSKVIPTAENASRA